MKLNLLPKTTGYLWMRDTYVVFKKNPRVYIAIVATAYIFIFLFSWLPIIGTILALMAGMLCSATIMIAAEELLHERLNPRGPVIFDILNLLYKRQSIFILAFIYALCYSALLAFLLYVFQESFPNLYAEGLRYTVLLKSPETLSPEELINAHIYTKISWPLFLVPYLLLFSSFCMTPALIYWDKVPPIKAIVFNLVACIKNWQTWLMFIAGWTAITLAFLLLVLMLFALCSLLFGKAGIALGIIVGLSLLLAFFILGVAIMNLALYFAYQSSFVVTKEKNNHMP